MSEKYIDFDHLKTNRYAIFKYLWIKSSEVMEGLTPMMKQYYRIKEKYKDALLFFRVGDFYELFDDDAKIASQELGIVLTTRDKRHFMAGVPHHAVFPYVKRLIDKGYKVAICEQVEDPSKAKGLVKREVIRVITPGTLIEEELLTKENNYLMAVYEGKIFGLAFIDISTNEFFTIALESFEDVIAEVMKFSPAECIIPEDFDEKLADEIKKHVKTVHTVSNEYYTIEESIVESVDLEEFEEECLKACSAAIKYVRDALLIRNLTIRLQKYSNRDYMTLDSTTLRNLEIFRNLIDGSKKGTLLEALDKTVTAMGSRLLKKWLERPLLNINEIELRLDAVEELKEKSFVRLSLREILKEIADLERIISRVRYRNANARDLVALKNSLKATKNIRSFTFTSRKLIDLTSNLNTLDEIAKMIDKAIVDDPPLSVKEGGIIKFGYDEELDRLRKQKEEQNEYIRMLEERERRKTGIEKLKVGYNNVIGYYIEVPKTKIKFVPESYKRIQTLVNAERYKIAEIEEREEKMIACEERIKALELEIFERVTKKVAEKVDEIKNLAKIIAEIDVLSTFAEIAVLYNYCKPKVNDGFEIIVRDGRHPTVELCTKFTPNDVSLDEKSRILIITGPNMTGKSTYLRMVALITIMAQIGCFVPASYAVIGVVDRIFTRIGSVDDITKGYSTFMVEMLEINRILRNATKRSLILLDEVGKSTGTKDGLSLAWSIIEFLHRIGAKTLFATHYHELSELENSLDAVKNYHFEIAEENGRILFDRKIKRGATSDSYGIKIAEFAKLPKEITERASRILSNFNSNNAEIVKEIAKIDVNSLTPVQALVELDKIVRKCREMLNQD